VRTTGWWPSTPPSSVRTTMPLVLVISRLATSRRTCSRSLWPKSSLQWSPPRGTSLRSPRRSWGAGSNDTNSQLSQGKHGDREALGRCRGGLSTKIHLLADSRCRPLRTITTAGQRHDSLAFELLMDDLRVGRHGPGRPRTRPDALFADKAYSNKAIRGHLRARGIKAVIPLKADQQAGRRRRGTRGRLPAFDAQVYRERNVVERAVNKLRGTPRGGHQVRQARLRLPRHH